MRLDESLRQRQPQARSGRVRAGRVHLLEFVEDALLVGGADADAAVGDFDAPPAQSDDAK